MNWWAISILIFIVIDLGFEMGKHGEPKTGNYNFWVKFISICIALFLYYKAGFFNLIFK